LTPPEGSAAALRRAAARLREASDTPRLDAELLLAHALGIGRDRLLLGGERAVPPMFDALVERRAGGEPVAYITGMRDFWDLSLRVTPAVLIPRPDSETLIEAAVAHFDGTPGPATVLDLGTGSGALLLAALSRWPAATGAGVDRSAAALAVARDNARRLGFGDRARFVDGDWGGTGEAFDLVLCNPPYIADDEPLPRGVLAFEPREALFAGPDGLDDYRALAPLLAPQLAPGGVACLEIGATQGAAVQALVAECGLRASIRRDLAGRDRCVVVTR
jgi:release factor glutamine methyltransferase